MNSSLRSFPLHAHSFIHLPLFVVAFLRAFFVGSMFLMLFAFLHFLIKQSSFSFSLSTSLQTIWFNTKSKAKRCNEFTDYSEAITRWCAEEVEQKQQHNPLQSLNTASKVSYKNISRKFMRFVFFFSNAKQIRKRKLYSVFILNFIYDLLWLWLLLFAQRDFKSAQEKWKRNYRPVLCIFCQQQILTWDYLWYKDVLFSFFVLISHGRKSVEWKMISMCARLFFILRLRFGS